MTSDVPKVVPLTCHGHSRPVPHISFSSTVEDDQYYLISACKDNNPMLRDGITGDWLVITLPPTSECCADPVIPGSVPFSDTKELYGRPDFRQMQTYQPLQPQTSPRCHSKVWDTHTGECLHTLQHSHICRAVAFPIQPNPQVLATGGAEKKLRIFDLTRTGGDSNNSSPTSPTGSNTVTSYEIGPGVHGGTIKSIIWNRDYNILTTAAEDRKIRWWDLRSRHPVIEYAVDGPIGSCELNSLAVRPNDPGILAVAAGKSVYLFDGITPGRILKKMDFRYDVASVAVNNETGRLVTGSANDTWARVYDLHTDEELEVQKGHHGPIWSVSFSPDGKLYGTGSEDGTIKLWKACRDPYGLWR